MQPIFRNVSQAVHFSYTIEAYPVSQGSALDRLVCRVAIEMGERSGKSQSGINFDGMAPMEMHLECSKIRHAVRAYLPDIEACAMEARFATIVMTRSAAIRAVAAHAAKTMLLDHPLVLALTYRHYQPIERRDKDWSLRAIGQEYGVSKDMACRTAKRIESVVDRLEEQAFANLAKHLDKEELIARESEVA